jgi:hypothetical protein
MSLSLPQIRPSTGGSDCRVVEAARLQPAAYHIGFCSLNTSVSADRIDDWNCQRCVIARELDIEPRSVTLHCADSNLTAQLAGLAARFLQLEIERVYRLSRQPAWPKLLQGFC